MASADPAASGPVTTTPIGRIRLVLLAFALVATLPGWASGEWIYSEFEPEPQYPANFNSLSGFEKTRVRGQARFRARVADERNKAMAVFGMLGLWWSMILSAGQIGRTGRPSPMLVIPGFGVGVAGAVLPFFLVPLFFESSDAQTGLPLLLLLHATIFGVMGATVGLGFAQCRGDRALIVRCTIGGVLGAFFGTFVAEVVNFAAFPLLRMYEPVPVEPLPRFLLDLFVALGVALGVGLAAGRRKHAPAAA